MKTSNYLYFYYYELEGVMIIINNNITLIIMAPKIANNE